MKRLVYAMLLLCGTLNASAAPITASRTTEMRDAVDRVTIAAENNGYRLVKIQAIDSALVERGYENPGVRILFIGKATAMDQAYQDYPPLLGMLPLKLTLIVRGTEIIAISDDLDAWKEMFPDPHAHRLIDAWREDLILMLRDFAER